MIIDDLNEEVRNIIQDIRLTKEEVESYQALLKEVKHQAARLQRLKAQGKPSEVTEALKKRIAQSILKSEKLVLKIEIFISTVEDARIREILRMKYIDDRTWKEIARVFGITETHSRRIVSNYIKNK